jgi:hypothetical protein
MKDIMPVATIFTHNGKLGSMTAMVPDASNDGSGDGEARNTETAFKVTLLDYIIGNTDRHGGNWVTDSEGKIWPIDNGLSMSNSDSDRPRFGMWRKVIGENDPSKRQAIGEEYLKPWRGKWSKIEAIAKRRGIDKESIAMMKNRYDHAMEGPTWEKILSTGSQY